MGRQAQSLAVLPPLTTETGADEGWVSHTLGQGWLRALTWARQLEGAKGRWGTEAEIASCPSHIAGVVMVVSATVGRPKRLGVGRCTWP